MEGIVLPCSMFLLFTICYVGYVFNVFLLMAVVSTIESHFPVYFYTLIMPYLACLDKSKIGK